MGDLVSNLQRLSEIRAKELSGLRLTDDELREAISLMAETRTMRVGKTTEKKTAASPARSLDDMF